jgi:DNA-binding FrmR family transcriptional regulator
MPLEKDAILTPEKKNILIGEVQLEIDNINKSIQSGQLSSDVVALIRANKDSLQGVLNKLFEKRGVITPQETNATLDAIDASKRARLQQDFKKGLKNVVILASVLIVLGIGYTYFIKSKRAQ